MSFIGLPLRLEMLATRKAIWRVMSGYTYQGDGFSVEVPTAWVTDLTSIPWWIPFVKREGEHTPASVIHDVVYAKGKVMKGSHEVKVSRAFADKEVYLRAMEELKTPSLRRKVIYLGVWLGGCLAWRRYRKKQDLETIEGKVVMEIGMPVQDEKPAQVETRDIDEEPRGD